MYICTAGIVIVHGLGDSITQVSKYLNPSEYGKVSTISICTWSNLLFGSVNFPKKRFIMARYLGGLTTFTRETPFCDVYVHAVPNESDIDQ